MTWRCRRLAVQLCLAMRHTARLASRRIYAVATASVPTRRKRLKAARKINPSTMRAQYWLCERTIRLAYCEHNSRALNSTESYTRRRAHVTRGGGQPAGRPFDSTQLWDRHGDRDNEALNVSARPVRRRLGAQPAASYHPAVAARRRRLPH